MIVTDVDFLKKPCDPVLSKQEANKIIEKLWTIAKRIRCKGLAANQIGIQKSVCIIQGLKPVALINPIITFKSEATQKLKEECLSLPGVKVEVERPCFIEVDADNWKEPLTFDIDKTFIISGKSHVLRHWDSFTVQHEIDHLNGILITDYEKVNTI